MQKEFLKNHIDEVLDGTADLETNEQAVKTLLEVVTGRAGTEDQMRDLLKQWPDGLQKQSGLSQTLGVVTLVLAVFALSIALFSFFNAGPGSFVSVESARAVTTEPALEPTPNNEMTSDSLVISRNADWFVVRYGSATDVSIVSPLAQETIRIQADFPSVTEANGVCVAYIVTDPTEENPDSGCREPNGIHEIASTERFWQDDTPISFTLLAGNVHLEDCGQSLFCVVEGP
jgi:hypothetical protein